VEPNLAQAHYRLGQLYQRTGQRERAAKNWRSSGSSPDHHATPGRRRDARDGPGERGWTAHRFPEVGPRRRGSRSARSV
jgi:hypothetical protein